MAHQYRRRRSRQREHEEAAHRRLRLLTDQLAGQPAERGVDPPQGPTPLEHHAHEQPSPRRLEQVQSGAESAAAGPDGYGRPEHADAAVALSSTDSGFSERRPKADPALKTSSANPDLDPLLQVGAGAVPRHAASRVDDATALPGGGGRHAARPMPWHSRLLAALLDRAPAGAYGLTSSHVLVLALVALGAVAMAVVWVTGAKPQAEQVAQDANIEEPVRTTRPGVEVAAAPTVEPPSGSSAEAPTLPSPTAAPTGPTGPTGPASQASEVVVDVAGKVRRPGIVVLPSGSRVADALQAAGGVRPGVDTEALNLARPLLDGEQVLVGLTPVGSPGGPAPTATGPDVGGTPEPGAPTALVNLNTATIEQLDTLPGVGPVTGQAILDWRTEHGAFTSVDELLEVDGIGDATLADLRDLVTV